MIKLLKKIYEAVAPVSRKEFKEYTKNMTVVIDGLLLSNNQQSEIATSLVEQVSGLQLVKAEEKMQKKENIKEDKAYQ